jgi:hypothetical protein
MQAGYRNNPAGGYDKIPQHAPYMKHWPITLREDGSGRSIASLWSAQPAGHVYTHLRITYDSRGNVLKRLIGYRNPGQRTCDQIHFSDCYWDVDPRHPQVVKAAWHPTPGDHLLRCTLYPPHDPGWFPSPVRINRIKVHVPFPPRQRAKTTTLQSTRPALHAGQDKHADASKTVPAFRHNGARMSARPASPISMPRPRLVIRTASASLTHVCNPKQLVRVKFTVVNEGGPLVRTAADFAYVQARDSGTGILHAASVGLPDLAHGQTWSHTLVLGTRASLGKLPGVHRLVVYTGPDNAMPGKLSYVPSAPYRIRLDVPAGYCHAMRPNLSPANMHRKR